MKSFAYLRAALLTEKHCIYSLFRRIYMLQKLE